jgi:peptide/nickel transport system permease protein
MLHRLLLRRLAASVAVLLGVLTIVFFVTRLSGDPVTLLAGNDASLEDIARLRADFGLDQPLPVQYGRFVASVVRGNFGTSLRYRQAALGLVLDRLLATMQLAAAAAGIAVVAGVTFGILAATRPFSMWDHGSMVFAVIGQTVPSFWLGILLILLFPLRLGWFYTSGYGSIGHLVLPAITLGMFHAARFARLSRGGMLDVLIQDYVRTARAKGLPRWKIVAKHGLRNAALPLLSVLGIDIGTLLSGAVVTETVFSWPGIGQLAVQSVFARDYPVVQAVVLVASTAFVLANLCVDAAYSLADPRIRHG